MATFRSKYLALLMLLVMSFVSACGGAKPVQTISPVRAVPPQPARDASGTIVTVPVILPEGTEFTAQTLDFLTSETATAGDLVKLEVDNTWS